MLSVRELAVAHGRAEVVSGVGLEVPRGRAVALVGRNGAGKSTTLKAVMGLVRAVRGTVRVDGVDVTNARPDVIARRGLGYVPEDRRVFPDMTVAENLAVARRPARDDAPAWTIEAILELFPNLDGIWSRRAGNTSGGEQQMLAVARALMGNPRLLVLDEPSEGLAPKVVAQMRRTLSDLTDRGLTVLLAEQNVSFAAAVADDAVILDKGRVQLRTDMAALAGDTEMRRAYLGV